MESGCESFLVLRNGEEPYGRPQPAGMIRNIASRVIESWYRNRLGKLVLHAAGEIHFPEIRRRITLGLKYLCEVTPPEAPSRDAKRFRQWLSETKLNSQNRWRKYYSSIPLPTTDHEQISFWDIPTLFPDFPLHRLFDFGRYQLKFNGYDNGTLPVASKTIEGTGAESFAEILKYASALQAEFAAHYFVLPWVEPERKTIYREIFNFSGQLLPGLALLADLIESTHSNAISRPGYTEMLKKSLSGFFTAVCAHGGSPADLLFMHGALCRFVDIQTSPKSKKRSIPAIREFLDALERIGSNSPIPDTVRTMLRLNPLSNLLEFGLLSDFGMLDSDTKNEIAGLFKMSISGEVTFWLANHAISGLMSPGRKPPPSEGDSDANPCEAFGRRIQNMGSLLKPLHEISPNQAEAQRLHCFLGQFYELLLDDWLMECNPKASLSHPLPPPPRPQIPSKIRFSHFSIGEENPAWHNEILEHLAQGMTFDDVAAKYAKPGIDRNAISELYWVERDSLPPAFEGRLFLVPTDGIPFHFQSQGSHYYILIRERQIPATVTFFEKIVLWTVAEGQSFRDTVTHLIKPIESLLKKIGAENTADVSDLRGLYDKAQFYLRLLEAAPEPATEVKRT